MSFQLSSEMDKNKVFLVNRSELEGRLDPNYYLPKYLETESKLKNLKHKKLADFCIKIKKGIFYILASEYVNEGIPFIRISNLKNGTITKNKLTFITAKKHEENSNTEFNSGDLLLSKTASLAISTIPKNFPFCNISQDIIGIKLRQGINSEFISIFLNTSIGIIQLERIMQGQVQQHLTLAEVQKIKIPLVEAKCQKQIISKITRAYGLKKQKEAEAQQLLDGIDDYLLTELGIKLPEQAENHVQSRIFTRKLSEVSGTRFDPNFNIRIKLILEQKSKYEYKKLKDLIITSPQYGANEGAIECNSDSNAVRYIRITDISVIGELKNTSWKTAENIEEQYILNFNDLLFARSGSVGRAYLHKNTDKEAIFAGYLIRFLINEAKADPDYIFYYCHSIIYKVWVEAIYRPAVQANINAEEYKSLPIVLPPLLKQTEIANHITQIRSQAKQLQQQAKDELEQAKKEVEAMILGEA